MTLPMTMPVHMVQPLTQMSHSVKCFITNANEPRKKVKYEEERYVVLTSKEYQKQFPPRYTLTFYKNEKHYRRCEKLHEEDLDTNHFCGFIKGKKGKSSDTYIALVFTSYTILFTMEGWDEYKITTVTNHWERIITEHFGFILCYSIRLKTCPSDQSAHLSKFDRIMLCATKTRLTLCSDTDYHKCLCSWEYIDIGLCFPTDNQLKLEAFKQALHPGLYVFESGHCGAIQRVLHDRKGDQIYEILSDIHPYVISRPSDTGRPIPEKRQSGPARQTATCIRSDSHTSIHSTMSQHSKAGIDIGTYLITCDQCNSSYNEYYDFSKGTLMRRRGSSSTSSTTPEDEYLDLNDYVAENIDIDRVKWLTDSPVPIRGRYLSTGPTHRWSSDSGGSGGTAASGESQAASNRISTISTDPRANEIFTVINEILKKKGPSRDTLKLKQTVRCQLCLRLYLSSCKTAGIGMEDWQLLAEKIGLVGDAINLISATVRNHALEMPAAEVVLKHWQYVHNKFGATNMEKCPVPCTKENLVQLLRDMSRADLVELVETEKLSNRSGRLETL